MKTRSFPAPTLLQSGHVLGTDFISSVHQISNFKHKMQRRLWWLRETDEDFFLSSVNLCVQLLSEIPSKMRSLYNLLVSVYIFIIKWWGWFVQCANLCYAWSDICNNFLKWKTQRNDCSSRSLQSLYNTKFQNLCTKTKCMESHPASESLIFC